MARPNLSYLKNVILFFLGIPCGIMTGVSGIANSVVVLPAAGYLLGLRGLRAVATAVAVTALAALSSLLSYGQFGAIFWGLALVLTVGQVVGASWGQKILLLSPRLASLHLLWGVLVTASGLAILDTVHASLGRPFTHLPITFGLLFYAKALAIGLGVGLVSRVIQVGGVLLVPALIYGLGLPPLPAQGTALAVLIFASLPSVLVHFRRGDVPPQAATWMSFGALLGGLVGAYWATHVLHEASLMGLLGIWLVVFGLMQFWRKAATDA